MVRHTFETARVGDLSTYEGLNTARGRARFIVLVVDYMTYLKSDPAARPDWDETEGRQTASAFLKLINNDRAWPFARQVVRDFQSPVQETDGVPYPLRYILEGVAPRTRPADPPPRTMDTILQYEKRLKWRNISARLTHLTSFLPETQQREELEGALAKLAQLQKLSGVDVDTLSQA